jgi:hypothetical protein
VSKEVSTCVLGGVGEVTGAAEVAGLLDVTGVVELAVVFEVDGVVLTIWLVSEGLFEVVIEGETIIVFELWLLAVLLV